MQMNTPMQYERSGRPQLASAPLRSDWSTARFVKEGILMQALHGTRVAAAYMQDRMVSLEVAHRVLLDPRKRRDYDRQ
ncbi:MAG: hypothetical protein ACRYF5_17085 [Janthinobacterium lividum]